MSSENATGHDETKIELFLLTSIDFLTSTFLLHSTGKSSDLEVLEQTQNVHTGAIHLPIQLAARQSYRREKETDFDGRKALLGDRKSELTRFQESRANAEIVRRSNM